MIDPKVEFKRLIDSDADWSLAKAKDLAIKHNFSDQFIKDTIRPHLEANYQLRADTWWNR
jgi:hypothetical protein